LSDKQGRVGQGGQGRAGQGKQFLIFGCSSKNIKEFLIFGCSSKNICFWTWAMERIGNWEL